MITQSLKESMMSQYVKTLSQIKKSDDITFINKCCSNPLEESSEDYSEVSFDNFKLIKTIYSKQLKYVLLEVYLSDSEWLELKDLVEYTKKLLKKDEKSKELEITNNMKKEYMEIEKAVNEIKVLRNHGTKFDFTFDYNPVDKVTIVLNREGCSLKDMALKLKKGERLIFMLNDGWGYNNTYDESCDGSIYWYNKIYGICARIGSDMGSILEWGRGIVSDKSEESIKIKNDDKKYRIVETQFDTHSKFEPEWFCANKTARNYGWNAVHDSLLMTTPTNTYDESLERIKWFSKCFEKPKNVVIHDVDENTIRKTESNQDFMGLMEYLFEKDYLNDDKILKDGVPCVESYGTPPYSTLRYIIKDFNNNK